MKNNVFERERKIDERGFLVEFLRGDETKDFTGQVHLSTSVPNAIRGNHFHKNKTEYFMVVSGKARLVIQSVISKETEEFLLKGERPKVIQIRPLQAHAIQNKGKDLMILASWTNVVFDVKKSDTYAYPLIEAKK